MTDGKELGRRLRERDRSAAAPALNLIETRTPDARTQTAALLAEVSPGALEGEAPAELRAVGQAAAATLWRSATSRTMSPMMRLISKSFGV